jgi:hypothetical protein
MDNSPGWRAAWVYATVYVENVIVVNGGQLHEESNLKWQNELRSIRVQDERG